MTTTEAAPKPAPVPEGSRTVTLKIQRFNPEVDDAPHFETYDVPALPTDRVLNLLFYVKNYLDGSFAFRRSCAHGVCGSDAMRINGVNRLACKVLVKDLLEKDGKGKPTGKIDKQAIAIVAKHRPADAKALTEGRRAVEARLHGCAPDRLPSRSPGAPAWRTGCGARTCVVEAARGGASTTVEGGRPWLSRHLRR